MEDGLTTRKLSEAGADGGIAFLAHHEVSIVLLSGPLKGTEYPVESDRVVLGRGADADLTFDDVHLSRKHAVLELAGNGFRVRDLDSTNGLQVNDETTSAAQLTHGDRFTIGQMTFQYVVQERPRATVEFEVPDH